MRIEVEVFYFVAFKPVLFVRLNSGGSIDM